MTAVTRMDVAGVVDLGDTVTVMAEVQRILSQRWPDADWRPLGLQAIAPLCTRLIHFTNCTRKPSTVRAASAAERQLGGLLGTADLLAQLAAGDYLDKCRLGLYDEFEASGFVGKDGCAYTDDRVYWSREDLMRRTPDFIHRVAGPRIEQDFAGAYHYASVWFGGPNPYLDGIVANCARLDGLLAQAPSA